MLATKRAAEVDNISYLLFVNPQTHKKQISVIDKRTYQVGRFNTNDILVSNTLISRIHFKIVLTDDGKWTIEDLSTSGTYVNRKRIQKGLPFPLEDEDVINLCGEYDFPFHFFTSDPELRKISKYSNEHNRFTRGIEDSKETINFTIKIEGDTKNLMNESEILLTQNNSELNKINNDLKVELESAKCEITKLKTELSELKKKSEDTDQKDWRLEAQVMECRYNFANDLTERLKNDLVELKITLSTKTDNLAKLQAELQDCLNKLAGEETKRSEGMLKLKEDVIDILDAELQCSICNEIAIEATVLNCTHMFCLYCITKWLKKKKECAVCRSAVKDKVRIRAVDLCVDKLLERFSPESMPHRVMILQERATDKSPKPRQRGCRRQLRHQVAYQDAVDAAAMQHTTFDNRFRLETDFLFDRILNLQNVIHDARGYPENVDNHMHDNLNHQFRVTMQVPLDRASRAERRSTRNGNLMNQPTNRFDVIEIRDSP